MTDGDLFAWGGLPPFQKGSDTSEAAALSQVGKRETVRRRIYEFIVGKGAHGATRDEIEVSLGYLMQTTSPRVCELVILNRIVDSGKRRLTRSKRFAVVYVATEPK